MPEPWRILPRMRDTVILGGGVIGAATAYYLSLRGIESTVVERRAVASGASGTAAGLLSAPTPADLRQPWGSLAGQSLALHFDVAAALDGPATYDFEPIDTVLIAVSEPERRELLQVFGEAAWRDAAAIASRCPWLQASAILGGVVRRGSAQLDPARFTQTLLDAARAEVIIATAESIAVASGSVTGVVVAGASHGASTVILAAGPWTAETATLLGVEVPVSPLKGQILRMEVSNAPDGAFSDLAGNYVVRKRNGLIYTGTTEEDVGFDERPTAAVERQILASASALAPIIAGGKVVERTACLRPLSADGTPIIGAVPGVTGAYLATGHGRKGILLSLATGRALAELITHGESESVDLAPFSLQRFAAEVP